MNEESWHFVSNPERLLEFLDESASARKLRLFVCACCRRNWCNIGSSVFREAVEAAERFADGKASQKDLYTASEATVFGGGQRTRQSQRGAQIVVHWAVQPDRDMKQAANVAMANKTVARLWQAKVVRHIIGNPFRPYPAPASWPSSVVQLASAMYEGQSCSFALHDALLEAGHSELAEHFKDEEWHPKGCWVLDLILGKK